MVVGVVTGTRVGGRTGADVAFAALVGARVGTTGTDGAIDGGTVSLRARQLSASKNATQSKAQSVLFA
jgi:hypothetical protein